MPEPRRIRPEELSLAVSKAVKLAQSRHKLELHEHLIQPDFARLPWWIVGRVLREQVDLDQAHKVSTTITESINGKVGAFQPVTIKISDQILVGFIEKFGNQLELPGQLFGGGGGQSF
jgi:hypothetical protein